MNKKQDLSEMINAMFGECDSEVARLLIEIFEVVKDSEPQELKCTCGQTREAGEIPSAFTGVPASKYKLCAVHGVPRWKGKAEPELIQGYTAEQWQELKEGKYLCEFSNCSDFRNSYCGTIRVFRETSGSNPFLLNEYGNYFKYCRPARLRGAMSPIWVDPVDKEGKFIFFDENGRYTGSSNDFTNPSWEEIAPDFVTSITKSGAIKCKT